MRSKQQCSCRDAIKSAGHWWSYRLIDGRKMLYEGKPHAFEIIAGVA